MCNFFLEFLFDYRHRLNSYKYLRFAHQDEFRAKIGKVVFEHFHYYFSKVYIVFEKVRV